MVNLQISSSLDLDGFKRGVSRTALGAALLVVAGCSTPDWADPTEWFDGDSGDANRPKQIEQKEEAGDYPALGAVPDEAGKTVSIEEAKDIEQGLKADRENAQYTDEKLRADTAVQTLPAAKAPITPPAAITAPSTTAPATGTAVQAVSVPTVTAAPIPQPVQVPGVPKFPQVSAPAVGQFPQTAQVTGLKQIPNAAPVTTPQQAYTRVAPGTGTTVISGTGVNDVFHQQLAASAATTMTLPAGTQFQSYPTQPLGQSAVTVSQIVRDTYNSPVVAGYGASVGGVPTGRPAVAGYGSNLGTGAQPDAVIFFETGSSRVGAGDRNKLKQIAKAQKQNGGVIRVVGHASSRTRELPVDRHMLVNLRMSQERSNAVVTNLIKIGVPSTSIVVEALSDSAPLTRESMPSAEAKNRRTEIFLVK